MEHIKFSVVVTIFNEENTIVALLDSLRIQTTLADEVILVDAGSSDETLQLISHWKKRYKQFPLRVIEAIGSNRSAGRNIGIESSRNRHIAVTDAGCEADHNWLFYLGEKFDKQVESVGGFYIPFIKKPIQILFSKYVAVHPSTFDPDTYLPSSRSLAFTKLAWEKAQKYPETLDTCEDLVFAQRLYDLKTMKASKKAVVFWRQADDLTAFFGQIKGYAKGDVAAQFKPHLWKIATVWFRYALFFIFPLLFIPYLLYPLVKFGSSVRFGILWLLLPVVQVTSDMGVLVGSFEGFIAKRTL